MGREGVTSDGRQFAGFIMDMSGSSQDDSATFVDANGDAIRKLPSVVSVSHLFPAEQSQMEATGSVMFEDQRRGTADVAADSGASIRVSPTPSAGTKSTDTGKKQHKHKKAGKRGQNKRGRGKEDHPKRKAAGGKRDKRTKRSKGRMRSAVAGDSQASSSFEDNPIVSEARKKQARHQVDNAKRMAGPTPRRPGAKFEFGGHGGSTSDTGTESERSPMAR